MVGRRVKTITIYCHGKPVQAKLLGDAVAVCPCGHVFKVVT